MPDDNSDNCLSRLFKAHYNNAKSNRTAAQIENDKWLIPSSVRFNRWFLIPAAVLIQFCCGGIYAWSVFNEPIEIYMFGEKTNTAALTFSLLVGSMGASAALVGPWLERHGPFKMAFIGTCGYFLGNVLACVSVYLKQLWLMFVGYGVLGGASIGFAYITPIATLQKWFPDKRGMAGGFAVCGFGAGSIAASPLQVVLIEKVGLPLTFIVLGGTYFVVMTAACFILRAPPPPEATTSKEDL